MRYVPKVIAQRVVGYAQTYDLEVAHDDHQYYLSCGALTSNSHAVSYALDSYMCAYLLTHYEAEWLCAYAEEYSTGDEKKRARAFSEIKALGYELTRVDINYADKVWTILPGKKFMPSFLTIKGVGAAAVDEILENRPYKTVYDLLWTPDGKWRHKKFNKRVFDHLIKCGAFESMGIVGRGKYFSNYRHMHAAIVEHWSELKKKNGRKLLDELSRDLMNIDDWTRDEKVEMYMTLVGALDIDAIITRKIRERLRSKGVESVDAAREGETGIYWFVVTDVTPRKTKKGKHYLRVTCVGDSGVRHSMNIWGWRPDGSEIKKYCGYLGEVEKSSWGLSTTPWKMRLIST